MRSLALRAISAEQLGAAACRAPRVALPGGVGPAARRPGRPRPRSAGAPGSGRWAALGDFAAAEAFADLAAVAAAEVVPDVVFVPCAPRVGELSAEAVREVTHRVLGLVQSWLAEERFADSRLVLVTRGAVAPLAGEELADPAHAAVWGLIRSAQAENPERFVLLDLDDAELRRRPPGRAGLRRSRSWRSVRALLRGQVGASRH